MTSRRLGVDFLCNICYASNMSPELTFGRRLQQLRQDKNFSQRDLAKKAEMDFTYLSKIENGKMPPPRKEVIERLATILGADINELLSLAGEIPQALKEKIGTSEAARQFICRHAPNLSDKEWEKLLEAVEKGKAK